MSISCHVECPHCESYIDLFNVEELIDEGEIYFELCGDSWGTEDWDREIPCPDCKEPFKIGLVEY